jgi:hypothetical protein
LRLVINAHGADRRERQRCFVAQLVWDTQTNSGIAFGLNLIDLIAVLGEKESRQAVKIARDAVTADILLDPFDRASHRLAGELGSFKAEV